MDSNTLNSRFKEVSEQIKKAVADDPALSAMIGVLLVMFESQSALNNSQSEQIKSQSEQIKSQSELIESQSSEIKHLTKRIESCQQSLVTNPSLSERQPMRISMEKAVRERMVLIPQARKRSKRKKKKYL